MCNCEKSRKKLRRICKDQLRRTAENKTTPAPPSRTGPAEGIRFRDPADIPYRKGTHPIGCAPVHITLRGCEEMVEKTDPLTHAGRKCERGMLLYGSAGGVGREERGIRVRLPRPAFPGYLHDIPRSCAGAPGKGRYGSLRRGGGSLPYALTFAPDLSRV